MTPTPDPMAPLAQLTSFPNRLQAAPGSGTAADLPLDTAVSAAPRGVYVHVPFCLHKCHYCDFYSLAESRGREPAFVGRLLDEIEAAAAFCPRPLETVFVGGGTPTLLAGELWVEILAALAEHLPRTDGAELTVEANPETVTDRLMAVLAAGGVNRVSLGAQSFSPRLLEALERHHDPASVGRAVHAARAGGIRNVNLDLIFGIPGQDLEAWRADLDAALALEPEHLSCYGLMYEPNTPLAAKLRAGVIDRVDEDLEAAMYETALDRLAAAGYVHYEISNWARPGRECRHNLLYWRNESWWPLGPSAAGHVAGVRWKNVPRLGDYLDRGPLPPITGVERLDEDGRTGETLMLGLRLVEGIDDGRLRRLLSRGRRSPRRATAIEGHVRAGLLQRDGGGIRLTRRGLLLADTVLSDLI